jgi:hypothetical protein
VRGLLDDAHAACTSRLEHVHSHTWYAGIMFSTTIKLPSTNTHARAL